MNVEEDQVICQLVAFFIITFLLLSYYALWIINGRKITLSLLVHVTFEAWITAFFIKFLYQMRAAASSGDTDANSKQLSQFLNELWKAFLEYCDAGLEWIGESGIFGGGVVKDISKRMDTRKVERLLKTENLTNSITDNLFN